jgi:hypothetical protein
MLKKLLSVCILLILVITFFLNSGCKKNPVIPPDTPDTTSHNFSWQIDTIGVYPSVLEGVWGTDINNVYAVGLIYYSFSPIKYTAIIHWDGVKWSSLDYLEGYLNSIYGFGKNDIWAVGNWRVGYDAYALITHWNGKKWTTWKFMQSDSISGQFGGLTSVWGTSSSNLYAVGAAGLILHYDGSSWTQQSSGTDFSLIDIWGFDKEHIFAAGLSNNLGNGVLQKFDGKTWSTITEGGNTNDSKILYGGFESVWGNSPDKLFLVGALCYEGVPDNWKLSSIPYNSPGDNLTGLAGMRCVRGDASNDIFICGDMDLIIHWNGSNWHIYNEFFNKAKNSLLWNLWIKDNRVFIVGAYDNGITSGQAVIYRGTR